MAEIPTLRAGTGGREIRLIISDFGGVICTFDYRIFCRRLAGRTDRTTDQVFAAAFGDRLQREFETGRLSGPAYHPGVMDRLRVGVTSAELFSLYGGLLTL